MAVVLILISAGLHAGWNLLGKKEYPSTAFFLLANVFGTTLFLPVLWYYWQTLLQLPLMVWTYLTATGLCLAVYFNGLARAYRSGDMSLAYPLARSVPVILLLGVALLLGEADQIGPQAKAGIGLVVMGCLLLPMRNFSDFRLRAYWNPTSAFALMAAVGTAGYSFVDDRGLRLLRGLSGLSLDLLSATVIYAGLQGFSAVIWLSLSVVVFPEGRKELLKTARFRLGRSAITGWIIFLTYLLILLAMAFAKNISYVVAFRQVSILVGTFLGIALLKEPFYRTKALAAGMLFTGLVLVAL